MPRHHRLDVPEDVDLHRRGGADALAQFGIDLVPGPPDLADQKAAQRTEQIGKALGAAGVADRRADRRRGRAAGGADPYAVRARSSAAARSPPCACPRALLPSFTAVGIARTGRTRGFRAFRSRTPAPAGFSFRRVAFVPVLDGGAKADAARQRQRIGCCSFRRLLGFPEAPVGAAIRRHAITARFGAGHLHRRLDIAVDRAGGTGGSGGGRMETAPGILLEPRHARRVAWVVVDREFAVFAELHRRCSKRGGCIRGRNC